MRNGQKTSLWHDQWCPQSPLIRCLSPRDIIREGYSLRTCVAELLMHGVWNWPPTWLVKAPILGSISASALDSSRQDSMKWRDSYGNIFEFSVKLAWEELRSSLKTHDKLKPWDVGPATDLSQLSCPLCERLVDSHEHLFFECTYSSQVWNYVRMYAGMENVSPHLDDVLLWCQSLSTKCTFKGVVGKLIFAAASYFIWMEQNARLFKNVKRHYNICYIPQRQIRGIPGDLSLGIHFPGDMSPGISGTE
ncbi:putative reverse transcriptase domain-containing protein [Tanacetum coccineum]